MKTKPIINIGWGLATRLLVACGLLLVLAPPVMGQQAAPNQPLVWTEADPIPIPYMAWSVQCADQPDSFYLVGGVEEENVTSDRVFRYDAVADAWAELARLPEPFRAGALACYQGKIYMAGGFFDGLLTDTLYRYDIAADDWERLEDLPDVVWGASMGAWDGRLYLAGGSREVYPYTPVNRVDVYDIATDTWTAGGGNSMPVGIDFAASTQAGQYLYIAGGRVGDGLTPLDKTQRYDMASNTWELGPTLTLPQWGGGLAASGSRLYILGGSDNEETNEALDKVDVLELADWPGGAWASLNDPLPHLNIKPVSACTQAMAGGEIWSAGGGFISETMIFFNSNLYRPVEPCLVFYFGDLSPESHAGEGQTGDAATYELTLYNTGTLTDTYDLEVSGNAWPTNAPTAVGPLAPGASITMTVIVDIPIGTPSGVDDSAIVTAVSQGDPIQSDSSTITTTALETPGVALNPPALAQSALPGEVVTYTLHLSNQGNTTDTYDLSVSGNEWQVTLPVTQTTLAVGENISVTALVAVHEDALAGEVDTATITATSQGDPDVSDSAELATTALLMRAVDLSPSEVAGSGYPGKMVEYVLHLTNSGNISDTYELSISENEWDVTLPVTQTTLAAWASIEVSVWVAVPAEAAEGAEDSVWITAASQGDAEVTAVAELITTADWRKVYLPVIIQPAGE